MPMEIEEERNVTVGGAAVSTSENGQPSRQHPPPGSSSAYRQAQPPGREWNRVGDFLTGRYDSNQNVWLARGMTRQYPMFPVANRFVESYPTSNTLGIDPSFLPMEDGLHHQYIRMSSRLPRRVWVVLAKSLGIKLSHSDKPILATILHVFTFAAALTFAIPGAWYTVYDISSRFSKTTVLIGSVQIVIGFAWASLGVYAHNIAGRLFSHKNFLECVRVHSKTFLKVSVAWLTFFLGASAVSVNLYEASSMFFDDTCGTAQIEILVCQVFFVGRVVYAVMLLLWNFIVTYVVYSVCRTHTIGIRRIMQELNIDSRWYEDFCLRQYHIQRRNQDDKALNESWYLWEDTTVVESEEVNRSHGIFFQSVSSYSNHRRASTQTHHRHSTAGTAEAGEEPEWGSGINVGTINGSYERARGDTIQEEEASTREKITDDSGEEVFAQSEDEQGNRNRNNSHVLFSNEDLLFTYWKFVRQLSITSRYLQRWLASWVAFVMIWDAYFIIYWTSHSASLTGILQFIIPLLILLLVCSAYAEVNAEGQRLLRAICPLEERLAIIFYFKEQPLNVTVFNYPVTYSSMMTVILGFSVAFASRMILDEITPS